jgi:hypothetical protein
MLACRLNGVPLIAYKGPKIWHKDVYPSFAKEYFQLLADLLVLGAITRRQSVVAPVDCSSPWISAHDKAYQGIDQVRNGRPNDSKPQIARTCMSPAKRSWRRRLNEVLCMQIPWRWDWRPGEKQHNGAGLCNCSTVAPGATLQDSPSDAQELSSSAHAQHAAASPASSAPWRRLRQAERTVQADRKRNGICCFPYLTGNAVFPACSAAGLGFYHFVDLQHVLSQPEYEGSEAGVSRVAVLNSKELGFAGVLDANKVRR